MKKIRTILSALIIAGVMLSQQSCIGSFQLTKSLYDWNTSEVGGKWGQALVFFALVVIPVYELTLLADMVVLNTIEFWSGSNPLSMAPGETETKIVRNGNDFYKLTAEHNSIKVEKIAGSNAGETGEFTYSETDQAWTYTCAEGAFKLKQ